MCNNQEILNYSMNVEFAIMEMNLQKDHREFCFEQQTKLKN